MKPCIRCGEIKELTEFYRHSEMSDGLLNKCKDCCRKESLNNRRAKLDYYRAYDRERGSLPHRKEAAKEYSKTKVCKLNHAVSGAKWASKNKHKKRSHCRVKRAIAKGLIQRRPCLLCGNENVQAHHEDYSKPLEVVWLCPSCHALIHKKKRILTEAT